MMKTVRIVLPLLLVAILLVAPAIVAAAGVVVGTSTSPYAVGQARQRSIYYVNDLLWVFYFDGTNWVWRTSSNIETWSNTTTVTAATNDDAFTSYYDGTYLHYARWVAATKIVYYRRGAMEANGTITWSAAEQMAKNGTNANYGEDALGIAVNTGGYAFITYYNTAARPSCIKNASTNGTWSTDTDTELDTTAWERHMIIVPLSSNKVYVAYATGGDNYPFGKLWDSGWGSEEQCSTTTIPGTLYSWGMVSDGTNVHMVFYSSTWRYTYRVSGGTWYESSIMAGPTNCGSTLTHLGDGDLRVIYRNSVTNHIYYFDKVDGSWDAAATDWLDESVDGLAPYTGRDLRASYEQQDFVTMAIYATKIASPWNIKVALVAAVETPTNFGGIPSSTSVSLSWVKSLTLSDILTINTIVRYSTTTYPTSTSEGSLAYDGVSSSCSHTGLTAGTTYFYSAWGEFGGEYSDNYTTLALTTTAYTTVPGEFEDVDAPPGWMQATDYTKLSTLEPLYTGVNNFIDATGAARTQGWIVFWLVSAAILTLVIMFYQGFQAGLITLIIALIILVAAQQIPAYMIFLVALAGLGVWTTAHGEAGG